MIGKTLGRYEITSQLGKGGMGEVFQAKDQVLGRDVAIKVLPEEFAKDADRVARFQREAKLLASLNHPNIAAIYGLEKSGGTNFLVLELVEGNTLADRIKVSPIPVEESLKLALQIAEALEAAHEKGIIHRDLKPANIKVTPDGKVKVLDFGLAKAFAGEQESPNLSNSPTLSYAATQQGVILGTAAYMSPEQARCKAIDKRSDIWAFGCVLFEMLTGQAAFQGEDVTEILASVVKGGANLDLLPVNMRPRVREILSHCLQKDLKKRYQDVSDAKFDIEQVAVAGLSEALIQPQALAEGQSRWRLILPWVAVAIVLTAIIAGLAGWSLKPVESRQVIRFEFDLPDGQQLSGRGSLAISPDGKQFVYSTTNGLYLRSMGELASKLILGTNELIQQPFFSPDGKWIGYFSVAHKKLMKIPASGGTPIALCDALRFTGASWDTDSAIVYGEAGKGIMRIAATGGTPETIVKAEKESPRFPQILPNGKSVLFDRYGRPTKVFIQSVESGEPKELFVGDEAQYIPTGHIVYASGNSLFAVPFDPGKSEVTGGPVSVVDGVWRSILRSQYAISKSGTLVYAPESSTASSNVQRMLVGVDRNGKEEPLTAPPNSYMDPRISPDGTKLALSIGNRSTDTDIWIWDLLRKTMTRLTFEKAHAILPLWTPDGQRIVFSPHRDARHSLYWKLADGTGKEERLASVQDQNLFPTSWASGRNTLVGENSPYGTSSFGIGEVTMGGKSEWKMLLQEQYMQAQPQISPDGRWLAYTSDESGQFQVYVRPFPDLDKGKWPVSTNGGDSPLWSQDGRELFYRSEDAVMVVAVKTEPDLRLETPKILFRGTYAVYALKSYPDPSNTWDVSPDSKRFLMIKQPGGVSPEGGPRKINIVLNWTEELKQRAPTK